jgi:hypothetical protein
VSSLTVGGTLGRQVHAFDELPQLLDSSVSKGFVAQSRLPGLVAS